ncbi:MAG: pantoate--beta-alanine ligase [SAR202 cluster bacterium Casp-Chloro-G4]|nr:pantoate--beta-alanine ligase [Chloroflexota bacterium]MDA1226924.1 pantoate--beta-alanine ligase [Chloroflexota bacterium]PKB61955.1 MAG: pantoate--beta-alanine ligase [SAR202 cluster bacterium Casp-Chloro-G4]
MKVIDTIAEFRNTSAGAAKPLGLVPTMGFLHQGHMSLVQRARAENATVAVSIFVNPTQFSPNEDFSAYPRNMGADLAMLREAGVDLVFAPRAEEVYPSGFETQVDVGNIASRLEGEHRPGHFKGVATVVCKLLTIVRPDRCYFGQKDAQQCLVIQRLNTDLNLGAEIVVCPTVREPDGLALSSRNVNLSPDERNASLVLYRALSKAKAMRDSGVADAEEIKLAMRNLIEGEPLAQIGYVSVADPFTLLELSNIDGQALASMAVHIGKTRLIDNMVI